MARRLEQLVEGLCPPSVAGLGIAPAVVAGLHQALTAAAPPIRLALQGALRAMAAGMPVPATLARAARALVLTVAYEQPAVHAALGYDPDAWIAKTADRRLAEWGAEIAAHAAGLRDPD